MISTERINVLFTLDLDFPPDWGCEVECDLEIAYSPGEPAVMYYPDGSGHPGAPAEAEWVGDIEDKERTYIIEQVRQWYADDPPASGREISDEEIIEAAYQAAKALDPEDVLIAAEEYVYE